MKKIVLIVSLIPVLNFSQVLFSSDESKDVSVLVKNVYTPGRTQALIKQVAKRSAWGWARDRFVPAAFGIAMSALPTIVGMPSENEMAQDPIKLVAGLALVSTSMVGGVLLCRQTFVTGRDVKLLREFTDTKHPVNPANLPIDHEIAKMRSHHELLTMAKEYMTREGRSFDKKKLETRGLHGFKELKKNS